MDWTCSLKEGRLVEKAFSKMPAKQGEGLGILEIAEKIESPLWKLLPIVEQLREHQLLEVVEASS